MSSERERAEIEALDEIEGALEALKARLPEVCDVAFGLNRSVVIELNKSLATVGYVAVPIRRPRPPLKISHWD